jgi:hypothetical protein
MGTFRRVEANAAGTGALGILIPPARRTFVILRPRALPWDLVLCRDVGDSSFAQLSHDEASAAAQALFRALRGGREVMVETAPTEEGFKVQVIAGAFTLIACPREPGRPYAPLVCSESDARQAVSNLESVLRPPETTEQEVYFNTRFFEG